MTQQVELVRKRQFPFVGGGTGYASRMHLDDAASATVVAVEPYCPSGRQGLKEELA